MKRLGGIAAVAWLLCSPGTSHAQTVEVTPFVGYRFGGEFFDATIVWQAEFSAGLVVVFP